MLHYFHRSLIHNTRSWKQPRCYSTEEWIQKIWFPFTQWNTTKLLKIMTSRILQANDGTRKHPEWSNPDPKGHTCYILIDRSILTQKFRMPTIQLADHMKLNKKEGYNVDASNPLRWGSEIIMGDRGWEGPVWEREGLWKKWGTGWGMERDRREV